MLRKCRRKNNLNKQTNQFFLTMYSRLEIVQIFKNVTCWDELEKVCNIFIELIDEDIQLQNDYATRNFIGEVSQYTFRRIENL